MKENATIHLEPCPFCGGEAYISTIFDKPHIRAFHSKKCAVSPDTFLMSNIPLKKQINAWNMRAKAERD